MSIEKLGYIYMYVNIIYILNDEMNVLNRVIWWVFLNLKYDL